MQERWLEAYLTSPVWRFVLSPGICGDGAYGGVMVPSVDRVGRYFPLTIVTSWEPDDSALAVACGAQAWFDRASQLHRAYVASLSALGWLVLCAATLVAFGGARSPFGVDDGWIWTQLIATAVLASGLGGYYWNVGASRLGVPIASLWVNLVPFFAVLWAMAYGFMPNSYQIVGGVVALSGVVYMQARKLRTPGRA